MPFVPDQQKPSTPRRAPVTVDNGTGRFVPDDAAVSAPPPSGPSFTSPFAGYDPRVRNAGTPDERAAHAAELRGQASDFVESAPAGFNKGVTMLAGLPIDTAGNVLDLLGMGYGLGAELVTGRPAGEFYEPGDRRNQVGTGEWIAAQLDKGTTAIGAGPVTQNPNPDSAAGRIGYGTGQAIPGALTARQLAASAAGGGAQSVIAEAGGDPATQAAAGLLTGRAVEARIPVNHPLSPQSQRRIAETRPPETSAPGTPNLTFLQDSASAAAAAPELAMVPQEMRGPLVVALMRGDRDMAERVIRAETLPVPIRMMEGQARGDSARMADEFNLRGTDKEIAQRFDEQNQGLIENLDTIRREVSPNVVGNDHLQNGQYLLDAYKQIDEPVRAEISAAYKALEDAGGGSLPLKASSFVDAANQALTDKMKGRYLPAAIRGDLDAIGESGGLMTFEQYENLRTNLATAARDADRGTLQGGGNAAAAIRIVRDALESMPMDSPVKGAKVSAAELKALADKARGLAKARFDRIRADPAYEAATNDPTPVGELSPFADEFVQKYVVKGKGANLQRMRDNLAADPVAAETMAAAALNYVKSKSGVNLYTNEGNFSQHGFNRALQDIMPRIDALVPARVAETLQQLGLVAHDLQRQRKGGVFNNSGTFSAAAREAAKGYAEGTLNTMVPGAQLGTFVRKRRAEGREKERVQRALDPRKYLAEPADDE